MLRASIRLLHLAACVLAAFAFATTVNAASGIVTVVEFYNAALQHYFISADPVEVALLDGGAFGGAWKRTGNSFPAWEVSSGPAGSLPVCRFFGTDKYRTDGTRIGPNSHFYTADPNECAFVKTAFQSVASDGKSYPAWTFESNAFAVRLPAGGACPTDAVSLYRSYNNGANGDPNHRYSTSVSVLQAMTGWVFEGLVMCLPHAPIATAVGATAGAGATATIGAAGGSLNSPDGRLTLIIPAGALASTTAIGIEPLTNLAPGRIGAAYRLTPHGQTFAVPITLTFKYADADLAGTSAQLLGAAFQTAAGYWQWLGDATLDATAKTVSVASSHFSDHSLVAGFKLVPGQKIVQPRAVVDLQIGDCYETWADLQDAVVGFDCDHEPSGKGFGDQWSVNGRLGGDVVIGTVVGDETKATYKAPANAPNPSTVDVSVRIDLGSKGKTLLVSNITIALDTWIGTATGINEFVTTTATVTWTLDSMAANVAVYKPTSGVATATVAPLGPCTFAFDPPTHAIDPNTAAPFNTEGFLTIDFNATPPTYHGYAFTNWSANMTSSCGPPVPNIGGGPWFGGPANQFAREATGIVNVDGVTIEGSAADTQVPPATFKWKFTRQQP